MPIRAVGFDIDGTLYAEAALYRKLLLKGLPRVRFLLAFNEVRREIRRLLSSPEYRARGIKGVEAFHRFQAGLVADRLGRDAASVHDDIEAFFYRAAVEPFSSIRLYPGVAELLSELKARGLRLGALSDFPCDEKVRLMGLSGYFDVVMTSEETGLVKPDRASFDLFVERLGVPASEILYVGNSERYDVAGSLGAGMRAAKIAKKGSDSAAEFVFSDYAELRRYLDSIIN